MTKKNKKKKVRSKCPVCGSTRIKSTKNKIRCEKCGYINKPFEKKKNGRKK